MPLTDATARQVLQWIGIELDRPLITQVSRFDPWKDPKNARPRFEVCCEIQTMRTTLPTVAEHQFLLPRLLLNELRLMKELAEGAEVAREESWKSRRDPICGIMLSADHGTATVETRTFRFCSELCRNQFLREPARYISVQK